MKFFADTANLEMIEKVSSLGILDGVTTNPSLMAKEGIKGDAAIKEHYKKICDLVKGDVSAEVIATDYEGMIREAEELASLSEHIVVKIPMLPDGLKAIKYLQEKGIKTNCTLIFNPGQAILAAKAGATYISPFLGRLDDIASDGMRLIEELVTIFSNYHFQTQILAASIRNPMHIIQCAMLGVDVVTCPPSEILKLLNHPLTSIGIDRFIEDFRKSQQ